MKAKKANTGVVPMVVNKNGTREGMAAANTQCTVLPKAFISNSLIATKIPANLIRILSENLVYVNRVGGVKSALLARQEGWR